MGRPWGWSRWAAAGVRDRAMECRVCTTQDVPVTEPGCGRRVARGPWDHLQLRSLGRATVGVDEAAWACGARPGQVRCLLQGG